MELYYAVYFVVLFLKCVWSTSISELELRRPLQVGDIVTPNDFIEIAKRLRQKVQYPGAGKGIVSSSKSVESLADKIFQSFFFTTIRFVPIRETDVAGLDALQALALSGDEYNPDVHFLKLPKDQRKFMFKRKCQYALVTRRLEEGDDKTHSVKRVIPLAKKLMKKRRLKVVNRRAGDESAVGDRKKNATESSRRKIYDGDDIQVVGNTADKKKCIWIYMCKQRHLMDTCHVYPECGKINRHYSIGDLPVEHREDEHDAPIQQIRTMLGIYIIDEEVEKILERRYLLLMPQQNQQKEVKRTDSNIADNLIEYYERLAKAEDSKTTSAYRFQLHRKEDAINHYLAAKNAMSWSLKKGNHFRRMEDEPKEKKKESSKFRKYLSLIPETTPLARYSKTDTMTMW